MRYILVARYKYHEENTLKAIVAECNTAEEIVAQQMRYEDKHKNIPDLVISYQIYESI